MDKAPKRPRWYFGGLAASIITCLTHPLDLLKVLLQTQRGNKHSIVQITRNVIHQHGVLALYSGLSASLLRQFSYSTARFGIYDQAKRSVGSEATGTQRVVLAAFAGAVGGLLGTPGDKVNVRMQNDVKLLKEKRYNYKHVVDGLKQIYKKEGISSLFGGGTLACSRSILMSIGTLAAYDQIKDSLIHTSPNVFADNMNTQLACSFGSAIIGTTITQPIDVLKTRIMNSKPGVYVGTVDVILCTAREGPLAFFKGYIPALLRVAPQTILVFMIYEQMQMYFGFRSE